MLRQPGTKHRSSQKNHHCAQHKARALTHNTIHHRARCIAVAHSSSAGGGTEPSTSGRPEQEVTDAAWTLLKAFSLAQFRGQSQQYVATPAARAKLRDALMLAYGSPSAAEGWNPDGGSEVLLGVVASDNRLGLRALRDWCQALGLEFVMPDCRVTGAASIAAVAGAVYIKYNSVSKVCYLSQYKGHDRGVLIQLGQGPLLGHFPLGFFDEAMSNPAPVLDTTPAAGAAGASSSSSRALCSLVRGVTVYM